MTVLRHDDNRGGLAYPFLPDEYQWQIVSRPLSDEANLDELFQAETPTDRRPTQRRPTLRWVKDDKVLDLFVPGMDTQTFLERTGLQLSMHKGGYVLSKRLSRVMRPYRYWGFFQADQVKIDYDETLDGRLWDGCGLVSPHFIHKLAANRGLSERQRQELLHSGRFEVTTLHEGGQDKGHVLVSQRVADRGCDFIFPAGSVKSELRLGETVFGTNVFIGLNPIHSEDQMCLDIQSLVNLHPFFQPEHLLAWAGMESELFLNGIRDGRLETILNRLYETDSVADTSAGSVQALDSLADWHVGEYIASGGRLMWFAGMVKAVAKQHLKRLGSRASKLRCPTPGGRYYIFPAAVGHRDVPEGHIELDPACATAWVNDNDWLTFIVDVLGGCDGDDAVWLFPFRDGSDSADGSHLANGNYLREKMLVWRSPNQVGEYVVLQPTAVSHTIAWQTPGGQLTTPYMQSRLLPKRIDSTNTQYGTLSAAGAECQLNSAYSIAAMASTIQRAAANQGVLGGFCNVTMLCKAIYGRLPDQLPANLEAVIDGSVKSGLDLTPVKQWNQMAMTRMVNHSQAQPHRAIPKVLLERLPAWLQPQAHAASDQEVGDQGGGRHWLDTLANALERHKTQYWAEVEALATEACPPIELFEHGRDWLHIGKELRQAYCHVIRQVVNANDETVHDEAAASTSFEAVRAASETFLEQWPADKRHCVLLGAAAYLYAQGPQEGEPVRDALIWQLGAKRDGESHGRHPGIAHLMIDALRQIGLLGESLWTTSGTLLHYQDEPEGRGSGVPVRLNGVWLNWLNSRNDRQYSRMSDVPLAEREQAKARIANFVQEQFRGLLLTTEVTDSNRVVTRTPHGNLFGYVQRDHELAAIRYDQWRIAWAHAIDGNVYSILEPVVA